MVEENHLNGEETVRIHPFKLRIGVTGHRRELNVISGKDLKRPAPDIKDIRAIIREVLILISAAFKEAVLTRIEKNDPASIQKPEIELGIISALASGADQWIADEAIKLGFKLEAIIPFSRDEYLRDFSNRIDAESYIYLIDHAKEITELDGKIWIDETGKRKHLGNTYEIAGNEILMRSDILIAVWDGNDSRGKGGTGQVVNDAKKKGMPVIWIPWSAPEKWRVGLPPYQGGSEPDELIEEKDRLMEIIRNLMQANEMKYHKTLASYFHSKPLYLDETSQNKPNTRKLIEQPWQQIKVEMWSEATKTLTNILFLDARTSICDIWQLLDDYSNFKSCTDNSVLKYHSFILKHAQTLIQHNGQLLALLQHEGFSHAKEQIKEILKKDLIKKAWLHTMSYGEISNLENVTNRKSVEIVSKWKFEPTKIVGFGARMRIAFHLIKLGEVGIIDIIKSRSLDQRIFIHDLITLALFPSEDCRYLAVAYGNGEVQIIELTWENDLFVKQNAICFFKYKLPQFEPPHMHWDEHSFIYQEEDSGLNKYDIKSGKTTCLLAPDQKIKSLEFRSSAKHYNSVLIALSSETSTQVLLLYDGKVKQLCEIESADTVSMCTCSPFKVAACFSNREVLIFGLIESENELITTTLKDRPTCMIYHNGSLFIPTVSDDLYIWSIDKCKIPDRIEMPPNSTFGETIRHIAVTQKEAILTVSQTSVSVLKISTEHKIKPYKVLALFSTSSNTYSVNNRDEEILLSKLSSSTEIKLSENKPRVMKLCIDGLDNLLLAWSDGTGIVTNCILGTRFEVRGIPYRVGSITGDPKGGFWIAESMLGDIYYIDTYGAITLSFTMESNIAHVQNLLCTEKYLIWRGWVDDKTGTGEEHPDTLIFFEKNNVNKILLTGKRFFRKAEGFIETLEYNNFTETLIVIFHLRVNENIGISIGSIEDYVFRKETHKPIDWMDGNVKSANFSCNNYIYLLSKKGSLYCVDSETLENNAVLTPSIPFELMSATLDSNGEILIADSESKIFSCRFINPR